MMFRFFRIACFLAVCLLLLPGHVAADPIAVWQTPWSVVLQPKLEFGDAEARRAFGSTAVADGQIRDTGAAGELLRGTPAVAKAFAMVDPDVLVTSTAQTSVTFSRTFSLSGSPGGWIVVLDGVLAGRVFAQGQSLNPLALVQANFALVGGGGISWSFTADATPVDPEEFVFSQPMARAFFLPDGVFTVQGILQTTAIIDSSVITSGLAIADAFNSLEVGVSATPVPEPSTLTLLGIGALSLFHYGRRRWKQTGLH